jgi:hypothetical protein
MNLRPTLSQQAFLRAAKSELGLDWDSVAARAGINARALKCYRLPDSSSGHRTMPVLAWRAIEELLRTPREPVVPQQDYLRSAMETLGVSIAGLAESIDVKPLTLKNWLRQDGLASHRGMPSLARAAIDKLLREKVSKRQRKAR